MSQEDVKPGSDTQEGKEKRNTDVGDVVCVLCIGWCICGAVWQFVDFGLLGGAQMVSDTLNIDSTVVLLGMLANVGVWVTGACICWVVKSECRWTAGARAIAVIATACVARLLVWLMAQLLGMYFISVYWAGAYLISCLLLIFIGWTFFKFISEIEI
ncbi:hypothetical protein [Enorma burkinafasonensis]|uniref:hypothetical protein n=1 Tax=Enorma burkinafasonensis TaxID=2590867 RepID=UPI00119FBDBD|nr:hypothetical protein [Enorma burkinafasonensis]